MRRLWMTLNALNVFGEAEDTVELCEKFASALFLLLQVRFAPAPTLPLTSRWWEVRRALADLHQGWFHATRMRDLVSLEMAVGVKGHQC
jgi:hypothetical protein